MHLRRAIEHPERPVIRLFGPLSIEEGARNLGPGDLGGVRPKQVLEILLAERGHRVPVDRLAERLWGSELPKDVAGSLQTFISMLRRRLTPDRERARALVVTETEAYRFATELVLLDLDRFDELLERSAREPTRLARASLEQALSLVRGEVLEDEPYATWALDLRGSYQGRLLGAHLEAADAALAELDYAPALAHAEAAAALDRFSERAHRTAMLALYALGRQHDALARYRSFRALLDDELALEPTAETRALEAAILRQEDVHSLLPRPIARPEAPAAERSVHLLGRERELETLEQAARHALDGSFALMQIEGDAGLGKTRMLDEAATVFADARLGRTQCSLLEQHLPYVPLAAALRDTGIELDGERLPALGRILPELALARSGTEYTEVEALEALVQVLSEHAPVVLLLDDVHSADRATIAALDYLQHRLVGVPGAIVTTVRTVHAPPDHPVRRLRPSTEMRLCPLTAEDLAPLGMPGLYEATGGNPRFVTDASTSGKPLELSSSLTDTLLAQLRAEGSEVYRMLLTASVLEQPFKPESLAEMLGANEGEVTEELERLCELRILRIDGFRFRFRYDLVRHVLLTSISPARKRFFHRQLDQLETPQPMPSRSAA
jgi:DNA-binding SARP family transcriptional activator